MQDLELGEKLVLNAVRWIFLQCDLLALMGRLFTIAGRLYPLFIQLILETCEHLEELALRRKLSPEFIGSRHKLIS